MKYMSDLSEEVDAQICIFNLYEVLLSGYVHLKKLQL